MSAPRTALPTGRWTVDTSRTTASLAVRNGPRVVHGTVPVTAGSVTLDGASLAVAAELDLSAIDTGNARRDRDLRRPGLLDLDRHPTMRFAAGTVSSRAGGWTLTGTLQVRGREVELELAVSEPGGELDGDDRHGDGERTVVATTSLDRRSVGIVAPPFLIGRRVDVTVRAVLVAG